MSLINDALKKAQKQRTGGLPPLGSMPGVGGERASELSSRSRGSSGAPTGLLLGVGLGAVGLLALGVAGFLYLRARPDTPAAPPERPVASVANPPSATTSPSASAATPSTPAATASPRATTTSPAKENVFVLPVASPPANSPAPAATVATAPVQPAAQPVVAPRTPPAPAPTPPPATETAQPAGRLEPRAMQFIDNIRVAGIRASATDSKVLMNDRVYRIGDIVEHEMGLRLVGITTSSLTFEDDRGGRYTRNF